MLCRWPDEIVRLKIEILVGSRRAASCTKLASYGLVEGKLH